MSYPSDILFCELCNSFHNGLMAFASHTAEVHQMSAITYWEKHPYLTLKDYENICRNPHEEAYRGCSRTCCMYERCKKRSRPEEADARVDALINSL